MLEHLSFADVNTALANSRQLLAADGVFRLFVPDMYCHVQSYLFLRDTAPTTAAHRFIELMDMGSRERERGRKGMLRSWLGNSRHLWMWDEAAMTEAVKEAGFSSVRRVRYLDSGDAMFDRLEETHPEYSGYELGIEARR